MLTSTLDEAPRRQTISFCPIHAGSSHGQKPTPPRRASCVHVSDDGIRTCSRRHIVELDQRGRARRTLPRAESRGLALLRSASSARVSWCRPVFGSGIARQVAVDRNPTDAQGSGDVCQRMLFRVVHLASDRDFARRHARRPAASAASGTRGDQPGQRALAYEFALELR